MSPQPHLFEQGFALLIGVGHYIHNKLLTQEATINDVNALEKILTDPDTCGYPSSQVSPIVNDSPGTQNVSKNSILSGLKWLADRTTSASTVLFYFSGHALCTKQSNLNDPPSAGQYYLLPGTYDPAQLEDTALSAQELADALKSIATSKLLIILDCCHADGFGDVKKSNTELPDLLTKNTDPGFIYAQLHQGHGHAVLLSSGRDQSSWLMRDQKHSVFTYHLLEALRGNTTSAQTRTITITNIFDYVSRRVPETVHQIYGPNIQQIPQINMRGEQFIVALTPQRRNAMAENKEITPEIKIQLADAIFERFNEREFHGLCLRIDTHKDIIDRLEGNFRNDTYHLVDYCADTGKFDFLLQQVVKLRPPLSARFQEFLAQ